METKQVGQPMSGLNKTKDWALVQTRPWSGIEIRLTHPKDYLKVFVLLILLLTIT